VLVHIPILFQRHYQKHKPNYKYFYSLCEYLLDTINGFLIGNVLDIFQKIFYLLFEASLNLPYNQIETPLHRQSRSEQSERNPKINKPAEQQQIKKFQ